MPVETPKSGVSTGKHQHGCFMPGNFKETLRFINELKKFSDVFYCLIYIIMKKLIISKSRFLLGIALMAAIISISDSCSKSSSIYGGGGGGGNKGGPGTNEVWIQGMAFNPSVISVTAGTTITWTNKDAIGHTVTSDAGLFNSGTIITNGTFSYMFATAGTYSYHCAIHPSMTGTVKVN